MDEGSGNGVVSGIKKLSGTYGLLHLVWALISGLFIGYIFILVLPIAISAMASGRGITLSVLEIGADNSCEHAPEMISNAASNNELALYKDYIDRLLGQRNFAQSKSFAQSGSTPAVDSYVPTEQVLKDAFSNIETLSRNRKAAFDAIIARCFKETSTSEIFTWNVVFLVLGLVTTILIFAFALITTLAGARWPWESAPKSGSTSSHSL